MKRLQLFYYCFPFLFIALTGKAFCDTLFVDTALTTNCTSKNYCIKTRSCNESCSSGYKAYNNLQTALDSMRPGDAIILRNGTYDATKSSHGYFEMKQSKNGSSWNAGQFNTLASYSNEWAILDGKNKVTLLSGACDACVIGYSSCDKGGPASLRFWKFERLEIKNGSTADGQYASGFSGVGGPFIFRYCYIHDNMATSFSNNVGGLQGSTWDSCLVEYCYFNNNGAPERDGDITIYSDYKEYPNGFTFLGPTYHNCRNEYRYNLFKGTTTRALYYKNGQQLTGRNPDSGHGYNDTYKTFGDKIHHNIFIGHQGDYTIYCCQDFTQIYNNIFDSCSAPIEVGINDEPSRYKVTVYNNTIRSAKGPGIRWYHTNYYAEEGLFQDPVDYFGYGYNNIVDSCGDDWNGDDMTLVWNQNFANANVHNFKITQNYFYRPMIDADDPTGNLVAYFGNESNADKSRFTVFQYTNTIDVNSRLFFNKYNPNNALYKGIMGAEKYKTIGNHVLHGDTTLATGGKGGAHPYLDGVTIPSYIGATDPNDPNNNNWVDIVLNLQNLGKTSLPPVVTLVSVSNNNAIYANSSKTISWKVSAENPVVRCSVFVSLDNAQSWKKIDTVAGLTENYSWIVTDTLAPQCYIKVTAVDDSGKTGSGLSPVFKIIKQLKIQKKKLINAYKDRYYSDTLLVESGVSPFTWTITVGYLPASLYLDSASGAITGVPHTAGLYPFTVKLTDGELHTAQDTFSIFVDSIVVGANLIVPVSITNPVQPNKVVIDTILLLNDSLKLTYALFANRADELPVNITSSMPTIHLQNGETALLVTIPALDVNDSVGVRAFIVVSNGTITDTIDISHPVRRENNNCDNISIGDSNWTPLSVTAQPDDSELPAILACFTPSGSAWEYDKTKFRVIQWYPRNNNAIDTINWVEWAPNVNSIFNIRPGKLFWINSRVSNVINFGNATTPLLSGSYTMQLYSNQWTDFSIPFHFPVLLNDIINKTKSSMANNSNLVDALEFYQWTKSGKTWMANLIRGPNPLISDTATVFGGAGIGYSVFNPGSQITLIFPSTCAAMSSSAIGIQKIKSTKIASWHIRLDFCTDKGNGINPVYCGYSPGKPTVTYLQSPPSFSKITAKVYDGTTNKFYGHAITHDLSNGGTAFEIALCNERGSPDHVRCFITDKTTLPESISSRWYDPFQQQWIQSSDTLTVAVPANGKRFAFAVIGTQKYFSEFSTMLSRFKLQMTTVYPNPCVNKLTVGYTLPYMYQDIKEICFTLFNLQGKNVWKIKLTDGFHAGMNSIVLDRKTTAAQKLSSGVYLLRMQVPYKNSNTVDVFSKQISFIF